LVLSNESSCLAQVGADAVKTPICEPSQLPSRAGRLRLRKKEVPWPRPAPVFSDYFSLTEARFVAGRFAIDFQKLVVRSRPARLHAGRGFASKALKRGEWREDETLKSSSSKGANKTAAVYHCGVI